MTREELIARVQAVAQQLGRTTLGRRAFLRAAGIGMTTVGKHFDRWSELCAAAGIQAHRTRTPIPEDEIFDEMRKTFLDLGGVVPLARFERSFKFTRNIFQRRGWGWRGALLRLRGWLEKHDPAFPYLDQLPTEVAPPKRRPASPRKRTPPIDVHAPIGARLMGERIDFGPLVHAPVNELGVVALFALVAGDLGYAIELLNPGFPDCEAKRRVPGNRWERVRIEFEYQSGTFVRHGHDRTGCDLIVCWEDNWKPDKIEVLELRSVIATLRGRLAPEATETLAIKG